MELVVNEVFLNYTVVLLGSSLIASCRGYMWFRKRKSFELVTILDIEEIETNVAAVGVVVIEIVKNMTLWWRTFFRTLVINNLSDGMLINV